MAGCWAVDAFNLRPETRSAFRLLSAEPEPSPDVELSSLRGLNFTLMETECEPGTRARLDDCDFKENGVSGARAAVSPVSPCVPLCPPVSPCVPRAPPVFTKIKNHPTITAGKDPRAQLQTLCFYLFPSPRGAEGPQALVPPAPRQRGHL
uniref:Cathelicidin antimicrobial peptide n=1 Tax=Nothoprocta perdicaria TaxID=30464 RepID=A0A8C6ZXH8_NOTPE